MVKRLKSIRRTAWVSNMVFLIKHQAIKNGDIFRWHDSGDMQDVAHFKKIIEVCRLTPGIKHWLPTRELGIVSMVKDIPNNLAIRQSMPMIDGRPVKMSLGALTSTVISSKDKARPTDWICPAIEQDGQCKECRACWNKNISNVAYLEH